MKNRSKQVRLIALISCLFIIVFLLPLVTHAQAIGVSVPLKVTQANLPITIGVPFSEAAAILTPSQLVLTDPSGNAIPAQMRVLARWRGPLNQETKAIKWLLLDFAPSVTGTYVLRQGTATTANAEHIQIQPANNKISVIANRVSLDVATTGTALLPSFKLDGQENLLAPFKVQGIFPRSAMVTVKPSASDKLIVNETSLLVPGMQVRFEHTATLKWAVEKGWSSVWTHDQNVQGNRRYLLDEGTPQAEELLVVETDYGTMKLSAPLKFDHPAGAKLRDLSIEQTSATIKSINGQEISFTEPLKVTHVTGDVLRAAQLPAVEALASVDNTSIEEANALRVVIKQQGHFIITGNASSELSSAAPTNPAPPLSFTVRYYIYQDQPFVRVRLRLMNEGTYGFGATRLQTGPYAQHILIRSLTALLPVANSTNQSLRITKASDAYAKTAARESAGQLSTGTFEIAVPEFAENYPKALQTDANGLRFDVLPEIGSEYQFDGARAKTTDFYLGQKTKAALSLTSSLRAVVDPAYVARTGAVRPLMVEKRDWAAQFATDPEMAEAAARSERYFAVGYAVEASDGNSHNPAQSIAEYRVRDEMGANLGWRNFGDLAWAAGYANAHYDIPYILLREFLRTGDMRAFQIGNEMTRYRADWGQYHANDYWDFEHAYNMRGVAFYEKGDHGSDMIPLLTHNWIEGMWLHWVITGDEAVHESAVEGSEALARFMNHEFTIDNAVKWNESRWIGWPALGLMASWRYTGDLRYLTGARKAVYSLMQAEISAGKKGWFIPATSGIGPITQPFMWAGYSQLGVIEYWRETGDNRVADFIVRVADWLLGKTGAQAVLQGGKTNPNGTYQPLGAELQWAPDRKLETPVNEVAMLNLPLLTTAARITNRSDLRTTARQLFRDVAFYRDITEGQAVDPSFRALINFRSFQFGGSAPKVYGHTGLALSEYLPDLVGAQILPYRPQSENTLLTDETAKTVQVGQTLRVAIQSVAPDGSLLNITTSNLPENALFSAGELVFTPQSSQAGKVFQVTFTGTNANSSIVTKLDLVVLADTQAPQVKLLSPAANERLAIGKPTVLTWEMSAATAVSSYEIRLSTNGGASYDTTLATLPGNSSRWEWVVPESMASQRLAAVRFMVIAQDQQNRVSLDFTKKDLQLAGTLAIVSAANYSPVIAAGSLCSAFGNRLAVAPPEAVASASLFQRNGTTVEVIDQLGQYHRIPVLFADNVAGGAYDQVNFYLPEEVAPGLAQITITASTGEIAQTAMDIQAVAPAVFTLDQAGKGEAAVVSTTDSENFDLGFAKQDPTRDVYVSIFGTGWRFASAAQGGKSLASIRPFATGFQPQIELVNVEINGQPIEVLYAGAQPDYLGLDQINIRLPRDLQPGVHKMVIRTGAQTSNEVLLRVK